MFQLAIEFELDLDFHVDENGNEEFAKGLLHISDAAIRNNYKGQIVCGHCCSLAAQTAENLEIMLQAANRANITIVSLPMVNQWLQNRCELGEKTPRRRGIPLLKEITTRNIPVCLAVIKHQRSILWIWRLGYARSFSSQRLHCPFRPSFSWGLA